MGLLGTGRRRAVCIAAARCHRASVGTKRAVRLARRQLRAALEHRTWRPEAARAGESARPAGSVTLIATNEERTMPKGEQRSNKMQKKPKKDALIPKDSSSPSTRPVPPMTVVPPKGKLKNK
jgi:hypothetical protein